MEAARAHTVRETVKRSLGATIHFSPGLAVILT
jgi:hypothetical protein